MKNLAVFQPEVAQKVSRTRTSRKLHGKPLIAYTIEAAMQSGLFEDIVVSTDSERYARIATDYGANVPFLRPDELATDEASLGM